MTAQRKDRRQSFRFDKAFPVYLSGDEGVTRGIARNISEGGMFIETSDPWHIGARLQVTFVSPVTGVEIAMSARVRYQCFLSCKGASGDSNVLRGMGLRFVEPLSLEEAMPGLSQAAQASPSARQAATFNAANRVLH